MSTSPVNPSGPNPPSPINKHTTGFCPPPPGGGGGFYASIPDWQDHPSWLTGMQALEEFHHWVAAVVLPIAFEWIEDNKEEVYSLIPDRDDNEDDVGAVIAAAYQLVRQKGKGFARGTEAGVDLKNRLAKGDLNISKLNPIWAKITKEVREATKDAFEDERDFLDDTI